MTNRRIFTRSVAAVAVAALAAAGCSSAEDAVLGPEDTGDTAPVETTSTTTAAPDEPAPAELVEAIEEVIDGQAAGCELLDGASCLLPWPSDSFTVEAEPVSRDDDLGAGNALQISFEVDQMVANAEGTPIDPTEWNKLDGFSPGTAMITVVPGLDAEESELPPVTDVAASLDDDSPVVLVDVDSGVRVPAWAELDANVSDADRQPLMVRPAVNLTEGHRHVIGLRNLRDADGAVLEAPPAFQVVRDRLTTEIDEIEVTRPRVEQAIRDLEGQDVEADELYVAWDFTVASRRSLAERMLHIRDDGFAQLEGEAPNFEITEFQEPPDDPPGERVARWVEGTYEVPLYLTGEGETGTGYSYGDDGLPVANGTYTARFSCSIPESVVTDRVAGRPVIYGHGLLGSQREIRADHISVAGNANDFVYCATDWIGMAEEDIGNALTILGELSTFHTLADRVQQGVLNTLFLARLMVHPDGFVSDPAFQAGGEPLLDTTEAFYDGNSQGAIIGGMATAVAQDWTHAVLGVGGMNYSTLLRRSVDFDTYALVLDPAYPDELEQTIALSIIQLLWDRAETNGYAQHATDDPYPNTPEHEVILDVAVGDFQVSTVAAEVMARTMRLSVVPDPLADGRTNDVEPAALIPRIEEFRFDGSAFVYWDSGTPLPPVENLPPRHGDGVEDPHEDPRRQAAVIEQKNAFLRPDGVVIDVCDSSPCQATPRPELDLEP